MNTEGIKVLKNYIDFLGIEIYVPLDEFDKNLIDIIGHDAFLTLTDWFPTFVNFNNCFAKRFNKINNAKKTYEKKNP